MAEQVRIECEKGKLFNKYAQPIPVSIWEGAAININPASAVSSVEVQVTAPEEVVSGSDFTAKLEVDDLVDLDSFQVDIVYDPDKLAIVDVTNGEIGSTPIPIDMWGFIPPRIQGRARILGNIAGVPGVSGSGYLAEIHFHAK